MSNAIGQDVTGRHVIIRKAAHKPAYQDIEFRVFLAEGGFGCSPETLGTAVIGTYVCDGEKARVEGGDLERFATADEVELAERMARS